MLSALSCCPRTAVTSAHKTHVIYGKHTNHVAWMNRQRDMQPLTLATTLSVRCDASVYNLPLYSAGDAIEMTNQCSLYYHTAKAFGNQRAVAG